jgi:GntR family transcriptional regulator
MAVARIDLDRLEAFRPDNVGVLHDQISQWLLGEVGAGRLRPGDCLPNERDLSAALGVSRMTLRHAFASLERRGAIYRVNGRNGGTFVAEPRVDLDLTALPGLTQLVRDARRRTSSRVLSGTERPATSGEVADLQLVAGDAVYVIERVRLLDDAPLAVETSVVPAGLFPGLIARDLSGSLYALLEEYGHRPVSAHEYLDAALTSGLESELLGLPLGAPLLRIERLAADSSGRPVESGTDVLRSDRMRVAVRSGLHP